MDNWRWNLNENTDENGYMKYKKPLSNSNIILSNWICCITNRQMSYKIVWEKGGPIFSELVSEYSKMNNVSPKEILKKYYKKDKENNCKFKFKSFADPKNDFASRYINDDYKKILQTLEVLNDREYNRSIILFVVKVMKEFSNEKDLLTRIACALYLLTYSNMKPKNARSVIKNKILFDKALDEFKNESTENKKRLWVSLRDYLKGFYSKIFEKALKETAEKFPKLDADELIELWHNLSMNQMNQLELPGDVWNNRPELTNLFSRAIKNIKNIHDKWGMPKIIREIYNRIKNKADIKKFYPEQFDVTFDFVPRMCDEELCKVCLFSKNGVDLICIPSENRYCPVAISSCGYLVKCNAKKEKCVLKEGISKGLCAEIK